jgi:hypothetical protein
MKRANFRQDERGAITVDWVVMTAATVGLGIAATAAISTGTENLSGDVSTTASDFEISTSFGASTDYTDWTALNPGIVPSYKEWMAGFDDDQLLAHMNNMEQFADVEAGAGHPLETYHDEYYIAREEAASRGLL